MNKICSSVGIILLLSIPKLYGQEIQLDDNVSKEHFSYNTDSLLYHIKTLSSDVYEGRRTGTMGAEKARDYIIKRYKILNIQPLVEGFIQPFNFNEKGHAYNGANVLGYVRGKLYPDKFIVISAHYDHEGIKHEKIYNGADDNASGVGALLVLASYLSENPPNYSVILASFDAEELGLMGSKYFINNSIVSLEKIKMNINMDMISRNQENQLYVVGSNFNNDLKKIISDYKPPKNIQLRVGHDGSDGLQNWIYSGDHQPFYLKKIPFLYFGVEDHKDYHQPSDHFENINPEFYKSSVETIINVFGLIDKLTL